MKTEKIKILLERKNQLIIEIKRIDIKIAEEKLKRSLEILGYRANGLTFEEIGKRLGISKQRVHQIFNIRK